MKELSVQEKRKLLFRPCKTKEHFRAWCRTFLDLDFPDCTVLEESTSNPLEAAWFFYDRMVRNDLEGFGRAMTYSCRGGFKTLSAAALETMVLLHTNRNIGHMAAIDRQSQKSAEYVKGFFEKPLLREFKAGNNARGVRIVNYTHENTGEVLTENEFMSLLPAQREPYRRKDNYLKIVICTLAGSQSDHVEFFVVDELDVVPKQNVRAYHLAQNIPDPRDGMLPLTLLTSTRKSRAGLVQQEIDRAGDTGLKAFHWNLIDITQACEVSRHRPDLPRATYYVNDDLVKHVTAEEFEVMNPGQQKKWYPVEGFAGCRGCRIFSACKGRLATHQKSTSPMLKQISFAVNQFNGSKTPELITTEYLCRKPDATGLVYPRLNKELHCISAAEMAEKITGEPHPESFTKADLIRLLASRGAEFTAGMDFGFTNRFATSVIAIYGPNVFVIDCYSEQGLELDEQIANSEYLKTVYGNPPVYPDVAYPGSIKTFRRRGFKMKDWDKNAGSVKSGIEIVRTLLWSAKGAVRMFFLKDDPGVERLVSTLSNYKYQFDAQGNPTEEPDKTESDEPDSIRYAVMNAMGSRGAIISGGTTAEVSRPGQPSFPTGNKPGATQQWMSKAISDALGTDSTSAEPKQPQLTVKKPGFFWSG